jgi:hypothetical protein
MFRTNARTGSAAALTGIALLLSACSSGSSDSKEQAAPSSAAPAAAENRLAVSVEGGVAVLDATTLEVIEQFDTEEFTRLNPAGDGKHVFVTTSKGFQLLDTAEPALTERVFPATTAGHVVRHAGKTVLFDDGTGVTTVMDTADLAKDGGELPTTTTHAAEKAHHGVSIVLEDGTLVTTLGDDTTRTGAVALRPEGDDWAEVATSAECPGIHGEGTAAGETVVFGCENGALMFDGTAFEKLTAPDEFGRMGNAYVSETSPIVVGDYKTDPDAEGYLLGSVALIDTAKKTFEVVELPEGAQYTFRDVARGPDEMAYILGTDGSIHVLDPESGEIVDTIPVVEAWEGPAEWQDPHPAIVVNGDMAYVTEPASNEVHAVDLTSGKTTATVALDGVPNEMAVALG